MNRVIIVGSPRSNGRSAHLAEMLFEANIDECPEDELYLVPVSELEIMPCVACGACCMFAKKANSASVMEDEADFQDTGEAKAKAEVPEAAEMAEGEAGPEPPDAAESSDVPDYPYCPRFDDDMQDIYALLPEADELIIVSPIFFSGAPASMKAVLDRLQPHFWAGSRKAPKRPATLHVIGEGGDPHGYGPLVSEVRSALAVAGFKLERVLDWVGKIDESGEITAEADVVEDATVAKQAQSKPVPASAHDDRKGNKQEQRQNRPKLDLSGGTRKTGRSKKGRRHG